MRSILDVELAVVDEAQIDEDRHKGEEHADEHAGGKILFEIDLGMIPDGVACGDVSGGMGLHALADGGCIRSVQAEPLLPIYTWELRMEF